MAENPKFVVHGSQVQKWTDDIQQLKQERDSFRNQRDELADMLAFGLSIANQRKFDEYDIQLFFESWELENFLEKSYFINQEMIYDMMYEFEDEDFTPIRGLIIVFKIAEQLYTIDQLIAAYKKKMERNHARQDGTADKDKGYV